MAHSIYQKIKFADSWKDDIYGDTWHYLYMHYEPTSDVMHIKDEDDETIICGGDAGVMEALRKILNFEGEKISEEEYDNVK